MFSIQERSTGTKYTQTVALLLLAFIFVPVLVVSTGPSTYAGIILAALASALLCVWAAFTWRRHSDATISSIVTATRVR